MRPVTLCFHAASQEWAHGMSIPPRQIVAQVRAIRRIRHVAVTFDDAFRSISAVLPDLLALGVPVTVFVCTGLADRGGAPFAVPELAGEAEDELRTMTWDEVREWASRGVRIGSHTVSHAHLPTLSDEEVRAELVDSKARIEEELARECSWIAYPYGEHEDRIRQRARSAGYARAFALRTPGRDEYAVSRVALNRRDSVPRALLKASPLHYPARRLSERFPSRYGRPHEL